MLFLLLLLLLFLLCTSFINSSCPIGEVQSAQGDGCIEAWSFLLGGSQLTGWRSDAEIWASDQHIEWMISPFPYKIDAPFGWWTPASGLTVCGGKNWDDDQVESRCWGYSPCELVDGKPYATWGTWQPRPPLIFPLSGGGSILGGGDDLWAIGGGDGQAASGMTQVLRQNSTSGESIWSQGPALNKARYGHCAMQMEDGQVLVVGGHDDQGVLDAVELINLTSSEVTEMPTTGSHNPLWGGSCWLQDGSLLVGGGMDGLFISHANAYSLTYPALNWQEAAPLPWTASGALTASPAGLPTLYGGFGLGYRRGVAVLEQGGEWVEKGKLGHSRVSGLSIAIPKDLWDAC